jgi:hypothetical protein
MRRSALALGDEGLRVARALGQLDLRHAHLLAGRFQDGPQELVIAVVGLSTIARRRAGHCTLESALDSHQYNCSMVIG